MSACQKFKSCICFILLLSICLIAGPVWGNNGDEDKKPWNIGARFGIEYDDNVTRVEQDNVSGDGDNAYIFELNGAYRLLDTPDFKLETGYDFYQSIYDEKSDFDFQSHTFILSGSKEAGDLDLSVDYNYINANLSGDDFFGMHMLIPRIGILLTPRLYTDISFIFQYKDFDTDNKRDATNNSIGVNQFFFFMENKAYVNASYRIENEEATGGEFDYFGHKLKIGLKVPAPLETQFRFSYEFKLRDYDNVTPSIGEEREDKKNTLRFSLDKNFARFFNLKFKYEFINNESNLATVDYTENIVSLVFGFDY